MAEKEGWKEGEICLTVLEKSRGVREKESEINIREMVGKTETIASWTFWRHRAKRERAYGAL